MAPYGTRTHRYYEAQSTLRFGANFGVLAEISDESGESVTVAATERDRVVLVQRDPGYSQNAAGGGVEPPTLGYEGNAARHGEQQPTTTATKL
jgi:hypothetical protein